MLISIMILQELYTNDNHINKHKNPQFILPIRKYSNTCNKHQVTNYNLIIDSFLFIRIYTPVTIPTNKNLTPLKHQKHQNSLNPLRQFSHHYKQKNNLYIGLSLTEVN